MTRSALFLAIMSLTASPAAAQITFEDQPQPAQANPNSKLKDPNKVICERQDDIGSRLGGKKVCKTALQWQEERREQRNDVERIQQTVNQAPTSG